jgi:hypothetical protein
MFMRASSRVDLCVSLSFFSARVSVLLECAILGTALDTNPDAFSILPNAPTKIRQFLGPHGTRIQTNSFAQGFSPSLGRLKAHART